MNKINILRLLLIFHLQIHVSTLVLECQEKITYEEIIEILQHASCEAPTTKQIRERRADGTNDDQAVASTNNIYALQTTVNDHRVMIDDHRKMIHYLMNNTVNVTHLNQYYADQHARSAPIWHSWRDVSLVLLIFICFGILVCFLIKRLRLLDLLTSMLVRRQQQRQPQNPKDQIIEIPLSNISRDYIRQYKQ